MYYCSLPAPLYSEPASTGEVFRMAQVAGSRVETEPRSLTSGSFIGSSVVYDDPPPRSCTARSGGALV